MMFYKQAYYYNVSMNRKLIHPLIFVLNVALCISSFSTFAQPIPSGISLKQDAKKANKAIQQDLEQLGNSGPAQRASNTASSFTPDVPENAIPSGAVTNIPSPSVQVRPVASSVEGNANNVNNPISGQNALRQNSFMGVRQINSLGQNFIINPQNQKDSLINAGQAQVNSF